MIFGNCMISSAITVSLLNDDRFFVQEGKAAVKGEEKFSHTWVVDKTNKQIIDFAKIQFIRKADNFLKIAKEDKNFKTDYEMIEESNLSVR